MSFNRRFNDKHCSWLCWLCRCQSTYTEEPKIKKNLLDNASNLLTNFLSGGCLADCWRSRLWFVWLAPFLFTVWLVYRGACSFPIFILHPKLHDIDASLHIFLLIFYIAPKIMQLLYLIPLLQNISFEKMHFRMTRYAILPYSSSPSCFFIYILIWAWCFCYYCKFLMESWKL